MNKFFFILFLLILIIVINSLCNNENFSNIESEKSYILPKIIYCYWDDENNKLMNCFLDNWKRKLPKEWTINFINNNNIRNYVSQEFLDKYNYLESFRFSDFLRLELLKKTGGIWLDISTIIFNGNFIEKYYYEMKDHQYDVCMYEFEKRTLVQTEPYLENWFIIAPKNSKFIIDLYDEFERARSIDFAVYKNNILKKSGINLTNTLKYDDHFTYLMQHAIIHYLLKTGNKYKINIKSASESFFKLHDLSHWKNHYIINNFMSNNDWSNYYAIKLGAHQRVYIEDENEFIRKLNNI